MHFLSLLFITSFFIFSFRSNVLAKQPYIGRATISCTNNTDTSNSTSAFGFTCNGLKKRCQAYLIYRSNPSYNTVSSISQLLASDPSQLSSINAVPENATFETNKMVIVPVNCSCSGKYYQRNTSYTVKHGDTYYLIIRNTFQGLTTCKAIKKQNNIITKYLYSGPITVPLRCACPTKDQRDQGVQYLLSYVVSSGNNVATISARFGANVGLALAANELTEDSSTIYPYTTLLVPLQNRPTSNQTIETPSPTSQPSSPPPTIRPPKQGSDHKWLYALGGYLVGGASMLAFGSVVFYLCFWRKTTKSNSAVFSNSHMQRKKKLSDEEAQGIIKNISAIAQSIKVYNFEDLLSATDNFSPNSLIKGSVYHGKIDDVPIAIKKMEGDITKEISILNKINHINLIHLLGICFNDGHWYLVYEYAVNGSLSDWICCGDNGARFLTWSQRIQIALDVATGLNYLHSFANPPYIHKNLTSSNVLLDSDFRAKISNLSLAKSGEGHGHPFTLTSHIIGTKGYLAPEYLEHGLVSTKLDVYAFGVLMMEIITGKEVASLYGSENMHLYDMLLPVLSEDGGHEKLAGLIDPSLEGKYPCELATLLIELVGSCLDKNPSSRPEIDEVGRFLVKILCSSIAWESSNNNSTINKTDGDQHISFP